MLVIIVMHTLTIRFLIRVLPYISLTQFAQSVTNCLGKERVDVYGSLAIHLISCCCHGRSGTEISQLHGHDGNEDCWRYQGD